MKFLTKVLLPVVALTSFNAMADNEDFKSSITLLAPVQIIEGQDLSFEPTLAFQNKSVVTRATDVRAAIFSATGTPGYAFIAKVEESSIEMRLNGNGTSSDEKITVSNFTYGGNLDGAGQGQFDMSGERKNLRVGGTAYVESEDIAGDYVGTATFRITYL